ncbi:AMP-binding protein [Gordonia sp. zg691]|uniref:AMP-binding protein n=1 Tax=Gordonia jinghuaiqii TaxID=2758710 RepID=A0A7D7LVU6_9ACTN|nr:AMP-binding protein [Gordonia jinghuaiqii]MBD0862927.1 AMP-binding protein [Gordonia jinghuaiqii]QMT01715.1 AMP-binding protein [Gordonia jinghuaiqii]
MNYSYSLTENALRHPDKVALKCGERRRTYAELNTRVSRLAGGLVEAGVRRNSAVGILMWNCMEFFEIYYACMRAGIVCVPLNYRMSADELRYELEHSQCAMLFTQERFHDVVSGAVGDQTDVFRLITTADGVPPGWLGYETLMSGSQIDADVPADFSDTQRIMYTSGTTARPKGAIVTHGQVVFGALSRVADFELSSDDVNLAVGPLYHVAALDTFATTLLYIGGTVVICERFDPSAVLDILHAGEVTCTWMAPSMVAAVLAEADQRPPGVVSLRVLVMGGEKAPLPMLEKLFGMWPSVKAFDVYGLTECQGLATILPSEFAVSKLGSVGIPARGREVRVIDDAGQDVSAGVAGEVLVRGPVVFPGYLLNEEATRDTIRDRWLYTGDMGVLDEDGFLYIVDRKKDMILSGGENIAASEVERVVYEVPGVAEAAVVARADQRWGEVPVAFVVAEPGHEIDTEKVLELCRARLAGFKVPKEVHLVDELPRTPSGKILKRELRTQLEVPVH